MTEASMKFIAGAPMNPATKVFAGLKYARSARSRGAPGSTRVSVAEPRVMGMEEASLGSWGRASGLCLLS